MNKLIIPFTLLLVPSLAVAWPTIKEDESAAGARRVMIRMVDATDGETPETGLTSFTLRVAKNGTSAAAGGTVTEVDSTNLPGVYYYGATTGEVDTAGSLIISVGATGAKTYVAAVNIAPYTTKAELDAAQVDVTATDISSDAANEIADHVLRRTTANVEASSNGDAVTQKSLYGAVANQVHKSAILGGQWTVYKSDGATQLNSRTITTDSGAAAITAIGN